uniref:Thioredoxin n=1 Tax=uncultured bacterium fosmid pJB102C1 TaxID=1478050 RepID=A0A0H3UAV3_9BACT|nr:hypothetical protein [uncultured bacterium fosmid pJB102C1]
MRGWSCLNNNLMQEITDASFAGILAEGKPVVVDFSAVWCGPCQMMKPLVEELAAEYDGKITVCGMDVDDNDNVPSDLGIMNIPCLVFFKNGQEVRRHVGACSKEQLHKMFAELAGEEIPAAEPAKEEKKGLFGKLFGK